MVFFLEPSSGSFHILEYRADELGDTALEFLSALYYWWYLTAIFVLTVIMVVVTVLIVRLDPFWVVVLDVVLVVVGILVIIAWLSSQSRF
jgi:general stress protein CsbA